jgi:transposase
MKPLTITDRENMIMALQDQIRRNARARYDHRLHGVLLVAQGMTCPRVAELLGDSHHTVVNWVRRFEAEGFASLEDGQRPGRPSRLSASQMARIGTALRQSPEKHGLATHLWDGPALSEFIRRKLGVTLKTRQCQRLFRQLGFRLRKPRPLAAKADAALQAAHKKTSRSGAQA